MRWPIHLLKNYHDPSRQLFDFPLKFGTYDSPSSNYVRPKQALSNRIIKSFVLNAADREEIIHKFIKLLWGMQDNSPELSKIMKPEICAKVENSLKKLKTLGYRTKLINKWEKVLEWSVYGYMRYEGLSPFEYQNFSYHNYKIHQINVVSFPIRMEFLLDKSLLYQEKPHQKELINYSNPFDIRNLPKESSHLHAMLEKYPVSIIAIDAGILSKLKFHIIDLYSKSQVVEGEKSGDEHEFHLIRYEKVFPKDLEKYENDMDYKRFMDTNFSQEQSNWIISDIDQYLHHLPIGSL